MRYRPFGGTGWDVSEVGYGMWGMAGWTGSDDQQSRESLDLAVARGCNFFDTAWAYGDGHSERLLGELVRRHPDTPIYVATKIPPKNRRWPARAEYALDDAFPPDHIREFAETSLHNLGVDAIDLLQFHVWNDVWADDPAWQRAVDALVTEGLVRAVGISVNRWEPANVLRALDTGLIQAVQVVYNIFDQSPEDELFPACIEKNIAVIARVPFDEGSLTGTLTATSSWPEGDFRNIYFKGSLAETLERVDRLRPLVPAGMMMPELALRHILEHAAVSTVIPGMRKRAHVEQNLAVSDGAPLPAELLGAIQQHRWERTASRE